jgi:hypothetical protein
MGLAHSLEERLKAGLHSLLYSGNNRSTQEGVRRKQQGTVPLGLLYLSGYSTSQGTVPLGLPPVRSRYGYLTVLSPGNRPLISPPRTFWGTFFFLPREGTRENTKQRSGGGKQRATMKW